MKDILWLIRKTIRHTFSKPSGWIVYIGLPIATVLLSLMLYGSSSGSSLRIGIVNLDGEQTVTQDAIAFVSGLEEVEVTLLDEASLREKIVSGQVDSGLVFEPGFADSVMSGSPDHLAIVSIKGAAVTGYVKSMLEQHISNIASIGRAVEGNGEAFAAVYNKYKASGFRVDAEVLQDTSAEKSVAYQSIGFLVMLMMFSATNMAEILLKERENRTFLRLLSSPVSARSYVLANVIVNGAVLSLQVILMLVMMKWVLRHDTGTSFLEWFAALFLFAVATVGLSLAIAAFSKNRKAFSALTNLIVTPTCLLSGCFFPASIMPEPIQKLSHFLPQRWLLDMIEKLQNGQAFSSLFLHTVILLAFSVLFALVAAYRFGRNNDTRQFV